MTKLAQGQRLAVASLLAAACCFAHVVVARWGSCVARGHEACFPHEDDRYDYQLWQSASPQVFSLIAGYVLLGIGILAFSRRRTPWAGLLMACPSLGMALTTALQPCWSFDHLLGLG